MKMLEIIVFDTDTKVVNSLRHGIELPFFSVVEGNGIEATRVANLDALWLTWMQAERFGITPSLKLHEAMAFPMPVKDILRGLPRFIVAGVALAASESRAGAHQLEVIVKAMLGAVSKLSVETGIVIRRIGTVPENLLLNKLEPEEAMRIISSIYSEVLGGY
jgi:hypothetical protein